MAGIRTAAAVFAGIATGVALVVAGAARADDLARAEEIVQAKCFLCHGADGESSSPVFPRLAGQNAAYVTRQLADYRSGKRRSSAMQPMVDDLNDADFAALGKWYATRPTHAHPVADVELAERGRRIYVEGNPGNSVPPCAICHGPSGHGTDSLPRIAGQHAQYVEKQLREFDQRVRTNDNEVMHQIARKLDDLEVKAVAAYLSGLQ
jgi:cytochrome c553